MTASLKGKLLAAFLLVFFAGLVAGAFLGAAHSRHHRGESGHHRDLAERLRHRMQERLELTPEQMKKTTPIFQKAARDLEAIRAETGRRVHDTLAAADRALQPELTAQQRAKLAKLEEELKSKRRRPH